MIGLPIFLLHKECEIYGWVLLYNPLLLQQCSEDVFPMLQAISAQPLFLAHAIILLAVMRKTFLQTSSRQWLNAMVCIWLYDKRWEHAQVASYLRKDLFSMLIAEHHRIYEVLAY